MIERYLSVDEAATLLGLKPNTVYRLAKRRQIPCRKVGGRIKFTEADLEAWQAAQKAAIPPPLVPWRPESVEVGSVTLQVPAKHRYRN